MKYSFNNMKAISVNGEINIKMEKSVLFTLIWKQFIPQMFWFRGNSALKKLFFLLFLLFDVSLFPLVFTTWAYRDCWILFTQKSSVLDLCWSIRGTSLQHSGGPSGPTATSPYALYLARSLEVSEISTRFHVTETLPAFFPPFLSPAFCLPSQVL